MTPTELLRRVGTHVCRYGTWPSYQDLDIELGQEGGIEPLLSQLRESLGVRGQGVSAYVFLSTAGEYAHYAPCGVSDLLLVARAAPLLAKAAEDGGDSPAQIPQVTAAEIQRHAGITDQDLSRVLLAIEEFGKVLVSGGSRGTDISAWSFGASDAAPYFASVTSWSDFEQAELRSQVAWRLRARRESHAQGPERFDPEEATQIGLVLDEILARVARLEALTEQDLREIRQDLREIKEDLSTLTKKQARRSVMGFLWKASQFGVKVEEILEVLTKWGGKLLPPG